MSSLPQDGGHQPSGSLREGKDAPAATNTAFENTPLLSLGRQSSRCTDLNTSIRSKNDPGPSESNGFYRVRQGHGADEDHDDLDEADSPLEPHARQSDHPRREQRLNAKPPRALSTKQRLWNTISKRLVFLQRDGENGRSPLEKDLVRRLDVFLLTFGCISQVIKYLDQTNISSAYVSGMKEDLQLNGNELNYFLTFFSISYCLMLIPSQVIITYVRPSYWLPGLEIGWGFVTALIAFAQNANQIYALRVLLGLFESSAWPGMMTLFMYWYTPLELAKRMGFYHSCQALGSMMSGALQVAVLESLEGKWGLRGWRWLFIINGLLTLLIGFTGFFLIPDYPNSPNPRSLSSPHSRYGGWLSNKHVEIAEDRLKRHGRTDSKKITWRAAKRTFRMWIAYFIPMLYIASVLAPYGYNYFNLFLKELKSENGRPRWSAEEVNSIPILGNGVNVVVVWIWAILSDLLQTRWTLLVAQGVIGLIPCIIMSVWTSCPDTTPVSAAYASYFMTYMSLGTAPLIMSWLSDILPQDSEARTLIVGYSIAGVYAILTWSQVLIWPASQAPYYHYAWQISIVLWILVIIMCWMLNIIDVRILL
ncbi:MFS general substrate transporter [Pseudoneurospora amorphoporcata]|uniref:MFS general substrate transporter n=1 Tax=Pseudoneurospora amorphoporcata TaxID=241081 RepID=A0AAN6SFX2_9PEZI|nr:MFS general substrate transporter [Pseudoneurospora amorphoporcata]